MINPDHTTTQSPTMSMTFSFPICEVGDSPKEAFSRQGMSATRVFLVPWERRLDFAKQIMGPVGQFENDVPARYPGISQMTVDTIQIAPLTSAPNPRTIRDIETDINDYSSQLGDLKAKVTVNYKPYQAKDPNQGNNQNGPNDKLPKGTWGSYRMRFSGEFFQFPGRALYWDDNHKRCMGEAGETVLIPITDHIVTWHRVSGPPWSIISALRGCVAAAGFQIPVEPWPIFDAETLLFEGCETDHEWRIDPTDPSTWRLTFNFKEKCIKAFTTSSDTTAISSGGVLGNNGKLKLNLRPVQGGTVGWNHAYRSEDPIGWHRPVNANGDPKYAVMSNFGELFQLDYLIAQ